MGRKELIQITEKREHIKLERQSKDEYARPKGIGKNIENFFYHYKWLFLGSLCGLIFLGMFLYDITSKIDYDVSVVLVGDGFDYPDTIKQLQINFDQIAPDANGDGEVHVSLIPISTGGSNGNMEVFAANQIKLTGEISAQSTFIYIMDKPTYKSIFSDDNIFKEHNQNGEITKIISLKGSNIFDNTDIDTDNFYIGIIDESFVKLDKNKIANHYNASKEMFDSITK